VVSVGRLQFAGFPGWVVWLFIHIGFLTGYRNRIGAVLSWWFAFTRDLRRERTFTTKQVGIVRDIYAPLPASAGAPDAEPGRD
jgi:NADH:quinone reductase (non-electrogenic)